MVGNDGERDAFNNTTDGEETLTSTNRSRAYADVSNRLLSRLRV